MGFRRPPANAGEPFRHRAGHATPARAAAPGRRSRAAGRPARPSQIERAGSPRMSSGLADRLTERVGARWVRHRPAELRTYETDGLPTHSARPCLVVLPGTREELIAVVRILHEAGTPWVARGAGTGLSGGALAPDRVLLVLTRLNRILSLDPIRRRAEVEPGVVNARLSESALSF